MLLGFAVMCAVITWRIIRSLSLLREFGTPLAVALSLVATLWLYMLPILAVLASQRFPLSFFYPFPLVALFFVPHLLLSRIPLRHLRESGTNRVDVIEHSISESVWLGYGGIAYVGVIWILGFAASSISSPPPL